LENGLKEAVTHQGADKDRQKWFAKGLFSAGERCGQKFGSELRKKWGEMAAADASKKVGVEDRLRKWCLFDSDVGFGRFELIALDLEGSAFRKCDIRLRESFLTPSRDTFYQADPEHRYNGFLRGYITGVLQEILHPLRVSVDYSAEGYESETSQSETCLFKVKALASLSQS
jgi:hypothetical protein